ncbi:hypothetical protein FDP41_004807 [Naegleria fowleri]|uniref:Uncharacterized protein n=1 Tax=Naegleria fowleri TaxID=5763 RepID=A0A6A5BMM2_NAEFO|nr:uncharacterized protein FDP41_004807 [Naegleria fowleri]KAF0976132.1 hypothetical protein FDP41_004807 [Naegleria fowleri]
MIHQYHLSQSCTNNNITTSRASPVMVNILAMLNHHQRRREFHRTLHNNSTDAGDQPDWSYWVAKESTESTPSNEKGLGASQSLFDLILNKDEQSNLASSYQRNETLENFFASQTEERLQTEQFESLESAFQDFKDLIQPPSKPQDLSHSYPLKYNREQYQDLEERVRKETDELLKGLTNEEIDKILWDTQLANDILKQKSLREPRISLSNFEIRNEMDAERMALDQFRRAFKGLKQSEENMSYVERKINLLTKSYSYHLQQKKRDHILETEKDKKEQMYNVFKKQADNNPEAFKTFADSILKKQTVPIDFVLQNYANGVTVEEITKMILAQEKPELAKPSYEVDHFSAIRAVVQTFIEARQEYCREILGVKTGRRHATGFTLYADRAVSKDDSLGYIFNRHKAIRDVDRIERTMSNLDENTPTKAEKAKRAARTARRRLEGQRLDNTMKVFMWVKKYKNHILK